MAGTTWKMWGGALMLAAMPALADAATPGIVSFKDAKKIKSWDAWGDHLQKKAPKTLFEKEKPCVTWKKLCALESGLEPAGQLETRLASDIKGSKWSIGCETMDRDYADWNAYKDYLPYLGAKRGRLPGHPRGRHSSRNCGRSGDRRISGIGWAVTIWAW